MSFEDLPIHILKDLLILCELENYNAFIRTCKTINNLVTGKVNIGHGNITEEIYNYRSYFDFSKQLYECRDINCTYQEFYKQLVIYENIVQNLPYGEYSPTISECVFNIITKNRLQEYKIITNICAPRKHTINTLNITDRELIIKRRSPISGIDFPSNHCNPIPPASTSNSKTTYWFFDKKNYIMYSNYFTSAGRLTTVTKYKPIVSINYEHFNLILNNTRVNFVEYIYPLVDDSYKNFMFNNAFLYGNKEIIKWLIDKPEFESSELCKLRVQQLLDHEYYDILDVLYLRYRTIFAFLIPTLMNELEDDKNNNKILWLIKKANNDRNRKKNE